MTENPDSPGENPEFPLGNSFVLDENPPSPFADPARTASRYIREILDPSLDTSVTYEPAQERLVIEVWYPEVLGIDATKRFGVAIPLTEQMVKSNDTRRFQNELDRVRIRIRRGHPYLLSDGKLLEKARHEAMMQLRKEILQDRSTE